MGIVDKKNVLGGKGCILHPFFLSFVVFVCFACIYVVLVVISVLSLSFLFEGFYFPF